MSSYVHICPGCSGRFRDARTLLWHTEACEGYAGLADANPLFRRTATRRRGRLMTAPTNVELLRRAAALMRERAQAATPGPWVCYGDHLVWPSANGPAANDPILATISEDHDDCAQHIVSWDPNVAVAVADWLDALIRRADEIAATFPAASRRAESVVRSTVDGWNEACALARAYLGADS